MLDFLSKIVRVTKRRIGNKEIFPFTIPSGIITTEVSVLERIAREVPEIGILTTKSIGPEPRAGNREPIMAEYAPHCFVNAVGLTNPGAEEFANKLKSINIPADKFLLISVFGKNAEEFAAVADVLKPYADGFELNLSCPHAKGYGMQLGQDPVIVREIVEKVRKVSDKPIFAKLTPNTNNIGEIAKAAMSGGAYGLTAINTVGPGAFMFDGHYVLTNKVGGMSGRGITPIGIKCVKDISDAVGAVPIIGCGGIYTAQDVIAYSKVGASFFGVGSALTGMNELELKTYFTVLVHDIAHGTNIAETMLKTVDMNYKKFKVSEKDSSAQDFHVMKMAEPLEALPGQFVFAWLPGIGEKPFSVMDTHPLTIGFLERGCFTKELAKLDKGNDLYFRGPYGNAVPTSYNVVLVGGGSGIAGIYLFAKRKRAQIFVGAKNIAHVPCLDDLDEMGDLRVSTEDGSAGYKGFVSDLLQENLKFGDCFINCGPKPMVDAVLPIELKYSKNVYSSLDRMTRCGVGICGSCADEKGLRTCVEGPFLPQ